MKVLLVVHDFLPEHVGGTEVHAAHLARALRALGVDVGLLFTERDLAASAGEIRAGQWEGLPTWELVHQREYADVRESWMQADSRAAFRRVVAEWRPDVVHFQHFAFWGAGCLEAAREAGAASVVTLHDFHLLCDGGELLRSDGELCETTGGGAACDDCLRRHPLLPERRSGASEAYAESAAQRHAAHRSALELAQHVFAPSEFLLRRFRQEGLLGAERGEVLPLTALGPVHPPRTSAPGAPLRVAYVGGVYRSKGVHVLVDAVGRLDPALVELTVHGVLEWFPDYVAELRAAARANVRFAGRFEPTEIDGLLAGADVVVVPSVWYENRPIALIDAFRCGLPAVATDLGGMAETVRDGVDGLLFPRGDASALAGCLERLAREPGLARRLAAARPALTPMGEVATRTLEVYREVRAGAR